MHANDMIDFLEVLGNQIGAAGFAAILIEFGLSSWSNRSFSKKKSWAIFLVILGLRFVYRAIR